MINNYYVRKVLEIGEIERIRQILNYANDNNLWQSGLNSGGGKKSTKLNSELSDPNLISEINNYVMKAIDRDNKFFSFTSPSTSNTNIVSKTESGNYYNPHIDNWNNGDYSTTLFLNSPEEYVGGELCLSLGNDDEKKIKLDAGWAVTYTTGILHRVNKVISGTRYVSVFWTKSIIADEKIRNINYHLSNLIEILQENYVPIHIHDCNSALKDPLFIAQNIKNEIYRNYSR